MKSGLVELPFRMRRELQMGLVDQMVAGLKAAIVSGRYAFGETLPSLSEMAKAAEVSLKVPRQAYGRLVAEGWLSAKHGVGYSVASPNVPVWKGRVLIVFVNRGHYLWLQALELQRLLERAGYIVTYTAVLDEDEKSRIFGSFESALSVAKYDLIYSYSDSEWLLDKIAQANTPYVTCHNAVGKGRLRKGDRNHIANLSFNYSAAEDLVKAVKEAKVRTAAWVDFQDIHVAYSDRLKKAGIRVSKWITPCWNPGGTGLCESVRRGSQQWFAEFLRKGGRLPDLLLFTDDYVADGAFCALAMAGIRIPEDVKVVTLYNRGLGFSYPRDFTRLEVDSEGSAGPLADFLIDRLQGGHSVPVLRDPAKFVRGETL